MPYLLFKSARLALFDPVNIFLFTFSIFSLITLGCNKTPLDPSPNKIPQSPEASHPSKDLLKYGFKPVSYTHLTLPTICSV